MFGNQAVRLIRENWGGVIEPDVNGNLVERGATRLAEELYAMFDDNIPLTQNAPLTLNKQNPDAPGLTINNTVGGNTLTTNGGTTTFDGGDFTVNTPGGNVTINGGTTTIPGSTVTIGQNGANGAPGIGTAGASGLGGFGAPGKPGTAGAPGTGFTLNLPDINQINFGAVPGEDVANNRLSTAPRPIMGRVVSGSGRTYKVELYDNGPFASSTGTVTASVPQIDTGETIPPGTWIDSVYRYLTNGNPLVPAYSYAFQPPVWI